jgi:hypothetical protein
MIDQPHVLVRLRRRLLQAYDLLLYLMLLALAAAAFLPLTGQDPQDDPAQCGNIQSSTVVIAT